MDTTELKKVLELHLSSMFNNDVRRMVVATILDGVGKAVDAEVEVLNAQVTDLKQKNETLTQHNFNQAQKINQLQATNTEIAGRNRTQYEMIEKLESAVSVANQGAFTAKNELTTYKKEYEDNRPRNDVSEAEIRVATTRILQPFAQLWHKIDVDERTTRAQVKFELAWVIKSLQTMLIAKEAELTGVTRVLSSQKIMVERLTRDIKALHEEIIPRVEGLEKQQGKGLSTPITDQELHDVYAAPMYVQWNKRNHTDAKVREESSGMVVSILRNLVAVVAKPLEEQIQTLTTTKATYEQDNSILRSQKTEDAGRIENLREILKERDVAVETTKTKIRTLEETIQMLQVDPSTVIPLGIRSGDQEIWMAYPEKWRLMFLYPRDEHKSMRWVKPGDKTSFHYHTLSVSRQLELVRGNADGHQIAVPTIKGPLQYVEPKFFSWHDEGQYQTRIDALVAQILELGHVAGNARPEARYKIKAAIIDCYSSLRQRTEKLREQHNQMRQLIVRSLLTYDMGTTSVHRLELMGDDDKWYASKWHNVAHEANILRNLTELGYVYTT